MFRPYELKQQRVVTKLIKIKNLLSKDYGYCEVKTYNSTNYDDISFLKFIIKWSVNNSTSLSVLWRND